MGSCSLQAPRRGLLRALPPYVRLGTETGVSLRERRGGRAVINRPGELIPAPDYMFALLNVCVCWHEPGQGSAWHPTGCFGKSANCICLQAWARDGDFTPNSEGS